MTTIKELADERRVKIAEVKKRLTALGTQRTRMPIPKGPMSTKGARAAMRGR